jgi:hypothetical protein
MIPFNKGNELIVPHFEKKFYYIKQEKKWYYIQQGLKITMFHCDIKHTLEKSFQHFADEVLDQKGQGILIRI